MITTRGQAAGLFEAREEVVRKLSLMWPRLNPHGFTLLVACIAALGAALVLVRVLAHGPRMDGDSIFYIAAANNLLDGLGFATLEGQAYANRPPLFSALLAAAGLVSFAPLQAAGWVNAAALGLAIFFGGRWLSQKIESRFLAAWACLAIAFTPVVAKTAHYFWSEPTFILFTTLALLQVDKFLSASRRSSLIWAAVFTALACMTRYIGVTLIAFTLAALLFQRGTAMWEKLQRMAAYALVAAAPIGTWLIRNYLTTETLAGTRQPASRDLSENTQLILEVLTEWMPPTIAQGLGSIATSITSVLMLAMLVLVGQAFVRRPGEGTNFVVVNGGFALFYIALMTAAVTSINLTAMDNRYLSPAYLPVLFTAVLVMDRILRRWRTWTVQERPRGGLSKGWRKAKSQALPAVAAAALCLWMALLVRDGLSGTLAAATGPAGVWSVRYWQESHTLASLRRQNLDGQIFTNARRVTDFFVGAPKNKFNSQWLPYSKRQLQQSIAMGDLVVYFHIPSKELSKRDYGLSDLRGLPELEVIGEFPDGAIFKVKEVNRDDDGDAQGTASQFIALNKPVIRSNFDLHINGRELIYAKTPCVRTDVRTRFFLHLFPSDIDDPAFPEERRRHGFDNLDFDFDRWGTMLDGACVATRRLPGYDIARIATGQYVPGPGHRVWSADFVPNPQ